MIHCIFVVTLIRAIILWEHTWKFTSQQYDVPAFSGCDQKAIAYTHIFKNLTVCFKGFSVKIFFKNMTVLPVTVSKQSLFV